MTDQRNSPLRTAAEAQLAAMPAPAQTRPVADLLHELQVHQIELEMQNETLRKVRFGKADLSVAAWAQSVDAADLFVSAMTIMQLELELELELGVLSVARKDVAQGALLRSWLEQHVLPEFSARTLPVDTAVALRCARLQVPDKRGQRDALIAATALVEAGGRCQTQAP